VALAAGSIVLALNVGSSPPTDQPTKIARSLTSLPTESRIAASDTVDLTIVNNGHLRDVPALVLPHDLAVTTTRIPVNAVILGTATHDVDFPVTLIGRDNVMGFSIVRLGVHVAALKLDALPASTSVVAVEPKLSPSSPTLEYYWTVTTLGDPTNDARGVVRYLATTSSAQLRHYVDAIAIDKKGRVVAVLSSNEQWYPARFVAEVANVVATGRGCHAELGIAGVNVQGGGVRVTKMARWSPAAHADLAVGDVLMTWNGANLNSWSQLVSTLYLTPAYTKATVTYLAHGKLKHATVSLDCPSKLAG